MIEWSRGDAEMALALKRTELNRALQYRSKYNADDHNICLALIRFKDGTFDVLAAYSNDSAVPESLRLGLNLIPDLSASLPKEKRFGCNGMAQFHTEPKLLNYLCATPAVRQNALHGSLPTHSFYRSVLTEQRGQASLRAQLLKGPGDIASITLVTEIDCCPTCTQYSVERFRAMFPAPLYVVELARRCGNRYQPNLRK